MIAVGFSVGHDTSIAVVADGKLIAAAEVERFSRYKHNLNSILRFLLGSAEERATKVSYFYLTWTLKSLEDYLNRKYKISLKDADVIAINFSPEAYNYVSKEWFNRNKIDKMMNMYRNRPAWRRYIIGVSSPVRNMADDFARLSIALEECCRGMREYAVKKEFKRYERALKDVHDELREMALHLFIYSMRKKLLRKIKLLINAVSSKNEIRSLDDLDVYRVRLMFESIRRSVPKQIESFLGKEDTYYFRRTTTEFNTEMAVKFIEYLWRRVLKAERVPPIIKVPHHLTHALSAYYTSGKRKVVAVTVDGAGEWTATEVFVIKDGEVERIKALPRSKYSLGQFYQFLGSVIGYGGLEGPGKVMGLAPYGKENEKYTKFMESVLKVYDENAEVPYEITIDDVHLLPEEAERRGIKKIKWNPRAKPLNQDAADFAYALQKRFEEAYLALMRWAKARTGVNEAVIAGGAALNAKANMEVLYEGIFNDVFFFPAAYDAGTAVGAAFYAYHNYLGGTVRNEKIETVFWGIEYEEDDVKEALKLAERLNFKIEKNVEIEHLVDHLLRNEVVVVYQGAAEFGPRALGHRSIVADPRIKENWERVNSLKGREWWRPLAPSLLLDHAKDYFVKGEHLPFMIVMERFKDEEACKRVPVVCHVDMTARPQTVTPEIDKNWYNLIKAFGEETGEYLVMNTSFNLGGEPLVETPNQAVMSFALGGFDALWMEGYLIRRR